MGKTKRKQRKRLRENKRAQEEQFTQLGEITLAFDIEEAGNISPEALRDVSKKVRENPEPIIEMLDEAHKKLNEQEPELLIHPDDGSHILIHKGNEPASLEQERELELQTSREMEKEWIEYDEKVLGILYPAAEPLGEKEAEDVIQEPERKLGMFAGMFGKWRERFSVAKEEKEKELEEKEKELDPLYEYLHDHPSRAQQEHEIHPSRKRVELTENLSPVLMAGDVLIKVSEKYVKEGEHPKSELFHKRAKGIFGFLLPLEKEYHPNHFHASHVEALKTIFKPIN